MNYATGYAASLNDLIVQFPYDKCQSLKKLNKKDKISKVKKIFKESIKLIVQDIIDNNNTFILPSQGNKQAELHIESFRDSDFEQARKFGKFKDVDFLESLFTGNQLYLYFKSKRDKYLHHFKKPVYINKYYKDQITKNTNQRKQYG